MRETWRTLSKTYVAPFAQSTDTDPMAGRPGRRAARQAAAGVTAGIPDAVSARPDHPRPAPPRYARAHAGEREALPHVPSYVGPHTRAVGDMASGNALQGLANELRPDVTVRIERLRPTWCSGWLEDAQLEQGGVSELYEHLREEWGGMRYRVTVLLPNGAASFVSSMNIAGRPRWEGRLIDRDEWEGVSSSSKGRERNAVAVPAPQRSEDLGGLLGFLKLFLDQSKESSNLQYKAVEAMVQNSAAQNQGLIKSLVDQGAARAQGNSFQAQLGEMVASVGAIEKVKRAFGAAAPRTANTRDDEDEDVLDGALKEATKDFLSKAIGSQFSGGPARQAPTQQPIPRPHAQAPGSQRRAPPPPSQVRPRHSTPRSGGVPRTHTSGIPDALQSGQTAN